MLSSIHPLGERARHNRWWITVAAFTIGAVVSGSTVGLALGAAGSLLPEMAPETLLVLTAGFALTAGILDISGVRPPGPSRQVNETWISAFRGWVYGGGFGLELGLGFLTYIVTWAVFATYVAAALTVSPFWGAVVGATFGLGRSLTLWIAGRVDRPSRLTSFSRGLAVIGPMVRRSTAFGLVVLGVFAVVGGVL